MLVEPVSNSSLDILTEIVQFVQERGWDIDTLEIYRFDASQKPFEAPEEWRSPVMKYGFRLSVAPRELEEPVAKRRRAQRTQGK